MLNIIDPPNKIVDNTNTIYWPQELPTSPYNATNPNVPTVVDDSDAQVRVELLEEALLKAYHEMSRRKLPVRFIEDLLDIHSDTKEAPLTSVDHYERVIHDAFNKVKARVLNLVDTAARDERQRLAMTRLIKGFINDSYFELQLELAAYLKDHGVLDPRLGHSVPGLDFEIPQGLGTASAG